MIKQNNNQFSSGWRHVLHEIVFESDTPAGKAFDVVLLLGIIFSIVLVILDSVTSFRLRYGLFLRTSEWIVTALFTVEYILRLLIVRKPFRYAVSFFGVIDFLAVVPTWISFIFGGIQSLLIIRVFRLLRIFRIFKLGEYLYEAAVLQQAMKASLQKIAVFLFAVLTMVVIIGSLMYTIEGPRFGFTDIPTSMYWAIVTLTTVGYGDIAPHTGFGKLLASAVMLLGFGIIAVPTGIVTVELANISKKTPVSNQTCPACGKENHDRDARYCKYCGVAL
jgi:voltage-gated potassium channel